MNASVRPTFSLFLMMLFGCLILLQMTMFMVHHIWNVQWTWNIFQYCLTAIGPSSIGHTVVHLMFNFLIVYTISRMIWRLLNQLYLSWKWNRYFLLNTNIKLTKHLNHTYRTWETRFLVVEDKAFVAITMGMFKPRIIVSTKLFETYSNREIEAILLHELYHCNHSDPMKAFLFAIAVDSFGYVPVIKTMAHYYKVCIELLADHFAIKQMGTEYYLGTVLLKLSATSQVHRTEIGVPFAEMAINYRIMQVLDTQKPIRIPLFNIYQVMFSLAIVLIMISIVFGSCY